MMRLSDATKLATTKLRTRKVRLTVTIVIAGLMFSVLAAASLITRGAFDSLTAFNKEGFGDRYIVAAYSQAAGSNSVTNPAVIDRALAINKDIVAKKIALAKKLSIPYDPKSERPLVSEYDNGPAGKQRSLDPEHPAATQALKEYAATHPAPGLPQLKGLAASYQPNGFFESKSIAYGTGAPAIKLIQNNKEAFDVKTERSEFEQPTGLASFTSGWGLMSRNLLKPFMLPDASATIGKDGSVPVVAPFSAIEQLMGLKALPESATPAEQLERVKQVRAGAANASFQACYRNKASNDLVAQAASQQQEIIQNKNNKNYTKPDLVYSLPTKACAAVPVASDTRSAAEKSMAAKLDQFDQTFGKELPQQGTLTFRVIGITPDPPSFTASFVSSIISSILTSNLGYTGTTWFTPIEVEQHQPLLPKVFSGGSSPTHSMMSGTNGQYVEFSSAASAKQFIDEAQCEPDYSQAPVSKAPSETFDPFAGCAKQGKYFMLSPFGSNSMALEEVKKGFSKGFAIAALAVAIVASIIMIGTVGRTIADSRRETAVFRAIGAKKSDIVQIYLIYTLFLSLLIFGFALLAGFLASQYVHNRFSSEITVQTLVAFNAQDLSKTFNFYAFYVPDIIRLAGLSVAGGFLSALFPLVRNLRRNPIRDMRDDT